MALLAGASVQDRWLQLQQPGKHLLLGDLLLERLFWAKCVRAAGLPLRHEHRLLRLALRVRARRRTGYLRAAAGLRQRLIASREHPEEEIHSDLHRLEAPRHADGEDCGAGGDEGTDELHTP
jgi:hypothetical protein